MGLLNKHATPAEGAEGELPPRPEGLSGPKALHKRMLPVQRLLGFLTAFVALSLVTAASASGRLGKRTAWLAPVLSPTISSFFQHGVDGYFIIVTKAKSYTHRWQRLVWDGVLCCGMAIGAAILAAMIEGADNIGDTSEIVPTSPASRRVGWAIVGVMFFGM